MNTTDSYSAFHDQTRLATGDLAATLTAVKTWLDAGGVEPVLIFSHQTGRQLDFNFQGNLAEVLARALPPPKSGPGRPKLGIISREVTLLPRHWDWLDLQPGRASATLRRLVETAMTAEPNRRRLKCEAAGRVMTAVGGNLPDYEEASRALYADDRSSFDRWTASWPRDLRQTLEAILE